MVDVTNVDWQTANPVWAPGQESTPVVIGTLRLPDLGIHGWGGFTIAMDKARYMASSGIAGPAPVVVVVPPADTLTAHNMTLQGAVGIPFSGAVATFTCSNKATTSASLASMVDWGDGTKVAPGVITGGNGTFSVAGSPPHSYSAAGNYTITTVLSETVPMP